MSKLIDALIKTGARKATRYVSPRLVVKACRRHKPDRRNLRVEFVVTLGAPNYAEREFIKRCKKAGEPFPVRKIQLQFYPLKKK
jgi:hypothetical protein